MIDSIDPAVQPVAVGNLFFFVAKDTAHGFELWRSDGTEAGTFMVKDINTTRANPALPVSDTNPSDPSDPQSLINVNGVLFFTAVDGSHGRELWKSNGTSAGTVMVKDINPLAGDSTPEQLTVLGKTLYFSAVDATHGRELWKSNGTSAGTLLVKDINPLAGDSTPTQLTAVGSTLYFTATDGARGVELWKSNGTNLGTILVKDINTESLVPSTTESSNPAHLTAIGGTLYFVADDAVHGKELWKTNGTNTSTILVRDINTQSIVPSTTESSDPQELSVLGSTLYFTADDVVHGRELWKTNGTNAGTLLVSDINTTRLNPGDPPSEANPSDPSNPNQLTVVGNRLFFSSNDGSGEALWRSDGTSATTVPVEGINEGNNQVVLSTPSNLTRFGGALLVSANDFVGQGLWTSDGTTANTRLLRRVIVKSPPKPTIMGTSLFFVGKEIPIPPEEDHGFELWITNGLEGGTTLVKDIAEGLPSSNPDLLTAVNGQLFFIADGGGVNELWISDGSSAGTIRVSESTVGTNSSNPSQFAARQGTLFFSANNGTVGRELWRTDGSLTSTKLVRDIFRLAPSADPTSIAVSSTGTIFFAAVTPNTGRELWRSDGTNAGTQLVEDIYPGASDSSPSGFTSVGTSVYFSALDEEASLRVSGLWKTDGTALGTQKVRSFPADDNPTQLTAVGDANATLLFSAGDGIGGRVLWRNDAFGTETVEEEGHPDSTISDPKEFTLVGSDLFFTARSAGIRRLWIYSGATGAVVTDAFANPQALTAGKLNNNGALVDALYFTATTPSEGSELWVCRRDATLGLIVARVMDICEGPCSSTPKSLVNVNGTLFFSAERPAEGRELWKSNGTLAGTTLVRDIVKGPLGSNPDNLTAMGSILMFTADDGAHGVELWRSNGTPTLTKMVRDINPGLARSEPQNLLAIGAFVYFSADDGVHGRELWRSDGTVTRTRMLRDIRP